MPESASRFDKKLYQSLKKASLWQIILPSAVQTCGLLLARYIFVSQLERLLVMEILHHELSTVDFSSCFTQFRVLSAT